MNRNIFTECAPVETGTKSSLAHGGHDLIAVGLVGDSCCWL